MGLWESFCGDTSLHGYQYIGRRERRPLWAGIVIASIILAVYFLGYNINEYMSSYTTTSLQTTTSSLDNIFYPSVTVCNMNQIRSEKFTCFSRFKDISRDSFWREIGLGDKTDSRRKKFVFNFFTGSKIPFTKQENGEMRAILYSPAFQKSFCNYLVHTSMEM